MKPTDITFLVSFVVGAIATLIVLAIGEWLQERRFKRKQQEREKASK